MATEAETPSTGTHPAGTRLTCESCGSEVEIISPCGCNPPDLSLRCCGREMTPSVGKDVHVGVE